MNYKIIKKIHEGFESDVFTVQLDGKTYIMKRYPIIDSNFKNYKMVISREIDMSQFINKLSKNKPTKFTDVKNKRFTQFSKFKANS